MLQKSITRQGTGIVTTVHRVSSITTTFALDGTANSVVTVESYVDENSTQSVASESIKSPTAPDSKTSPKDFAEAVAVADAMFVSADVVADAVPAEIAQASPAVLVKP